MSGTYRFERSDEISIAELNLREEFVEILDIIEKETARVVEMATTLSEGKIELVRKAYDNVRALKEEAQKKKEEVMEYLIRVSPNLLNKEMYVFAMLHLDSLAQYIDELAHRLTLLTNFNDEGASKEVLEGLLQMSGGLLQMVRKLREAAKSLAAGRSKLHEIHAEILASEDEMDLKYRKMLLRILENTRNLPHLFLTKEALSVAEEASDKIREASHVFRYLALTG
ncbi:MAG: hypothetical protein QXU97_01515 [Fervidicoccaceae archaeon]